MDNETKEMLNSLLGEIREVKERMKVIEFKVDKNSEKIDNVNLKVDNLDIRLRNTEVNIRKDIRKLSDENETMIEVLKIHEILPQ